MAQTFRKKIFHFNFVIQFIYLFIFRNKTMYCIPGYYFVYGYCYCFLELYFYWISINKRIKNIYIDMELYYPYRMCILIFPSTIWQKIMHYTQKNTVYIRGNALWVIVKMLTTAVMEMLLQRIRKKTWVSTYDATLFIQHRIHKSSYWM